MASPVSDSYAVSSGGAIAAGRYLNFIRDIVADGIWTWFTDPRAICRNGATYIMAVDSAGTCRINKYVHATGLLTSFSLSSVGLEIDDHNNGSILFLPDGRLVAFYGPHNDPVFRYRVSTNPEDIAAWSAEQQRGTDQGSYSYPSCFQFAQDPSKYYLFMRRWTDGTGLTRNLSYRTTATITGSADPWSAYTDVWSVAGKIPYWRMIPDGIKKMHVFTTDMHPTQGQSSLYHFYLELDGSNNPVWKKSDGTTIAAALPFGPSAATQVYDGATEKCWVSDATIDSTGAPCVLFMRYPGNDGSQINYWHARWNGSAWVKTLICADGAGLYSPEVYYHGGLCFDSQDASVIYLSAPISGVREIQEWKTTDNGASWAKTKNITSGTAAGTLNSRPYSPRNHPAGLKVLWWSGRYTTFTDYNTQIRGY